MPEYREQVTDVITPKFAADFEKEAPPTAEQLVAQAGCQPRRRGVLDGVSSIDDDSATALVAGAFTAPVPAAPRAGERVEPEPMPFRGRSTWSRSTASGWSTTTRR